MMENAETQGFTDAEWAVWEPLIEAVRPRGKTPPKELRRTMAAIDKSKNDLSVTCAKDGSQTATVAHPPGFGAATFGNVIAGGVAGVVVDAASGANHTCPDDIRMDLAANPAPPVALQAPPGGPSPVSRLQRRGDGLDAGP